MDTACHFTGGIKTGNNFSKYINYLRLWIDSDSAHGVVNRRPLGNGVKRALHHGDHHLGHGFVEFRILALLDIAIVFIDGLHQSIGRNVDFSGQFGNRVGLDKSAFGQARGDFLSELLV